MKPGSATIAPVFLLGLVLGAAAGSWGQRAVFHRRMQGDQNHQRLMLDKLSRVLGLDEKQRAEVSALMDSRKADVDKLKTETFSRLEAIRKAADADMAKTLTPEQSAKLAAMHRAKPMRINWEAPPSSAVPPR
jgi:Spy/CpxP family protein refolding chaperone